MIIPALGQLQMSEVMTCNERILHDEEGKSPDWIELFCSGEASVDLQDFGLRQAVDDKVWQFPAHVLEPGERLVVFASGKTMWEEGECHVPFRLSAKGDRLELVGTGGHVLEIPPLMVDVSYGYSEGAMLAWPTPGRPNADAIGPPLAVPRFSRSHGFVSSEFMLALESGDPEAPIFYTLDGSVPFGDDGVVYGGPIKVDQTTIIRAIALKEGHLPSRVATATYLFSKQILTPSESAPEGWPSEGFINKQKMVYGMEASANIGASYDELSKGLLSLPTLSLVMDLEDLLGKEHGVYVNALNRGREWERPVSIEWIDPEKPDGGYQTDAGVRMRGGYSRRGRAPKHGFRLVARASYGDAAFQWPFFGEGGPEKCQTVDLRTPQNHSWANNGTEESTFLRDAFCRDLQGDMGQPFTRGRYVHVYLNGVYWGVYQTHERVDADFAAQLYGGDPENVDIVKAAHPGILDTVTKERAGDMMAWRHLWESVNRLAGQPDENARLAFYHSLQGLDDSGQPDLSKPVYLDVANLIDYMMIILFSGNNDAPISQFFDNVHPNNWFAVRDRQGTRGFHFFVHDSEHSLGLPKHYSDNRLGPWSGGEAFEDSNPQWLHQQLMSVAAYREAFGDRAETLLAVGGALSAEVCERRLAKRVAELEPAIAVHAARWGGARSDPPRAKKDWFGAVARLTEYLRERPEIFRDQLRGSMAFTLGDPGQHLYMAPLYPWVAAPKIWRPLMSETELLMSVEEGDDVWCSYDGADPRSEEAISFDGVGKLQTVLLFSGEHRIRIYSGKEERLGQSWTAPDFDDSRWLASVTPTVNPYQKEGSADQRSVFARADFELRRLSELVDVRLRLHYEVGYVVYLNGQEVARRSAERMRSSEELKYAEHLDLRAHAACLREGRNVLALKILRTTRPFVVSPEIELTHVIGGRPFRLPEGASSVKARAKVGPMWSALALFESEGGVERASAESLVISEIMYHPPDVSTREARAGVKDSDEFEFLEFLNIGEKPISLANVRLIDGVLFQFPDRNAILPPGKHLVVAKNPRAFALRYGAMKGVLGPYAGGLKNGGEKLTLLDSHSQPIVRFRYDDNEPWPSSADGLGFSLTLKDPRSKQNPDKASAWRASSEVHGSPGRGEPEQDFAGVVINEVLTNTDWPQTDAIELHNPSTKPVDVGGWYLTDDLKEPEKWRIPDGTVIPAEGYWLALEDNDADPDNNAELSKEFFGKAFSLSSLGEVVYLFSADREGNLTGYTHGCEFDAMPTGIAYGRSINTAGKDVFAIRKPTLGEANGLPLLGPVLITEVHYHPGEDDAEEAMEFIEIWNRTDHPMPLFDPERPENVWALKGTKFTFPPGQTLAPNEGAVITRMAPEEFRKKRALPESMKIYGPFEGGLNNSGERLTLLRPLAPELDGEDSVIPMVPVDSLRYNDKIPWPDEADGTGRTLERLDVTGITDEPQSWRASVENGGTPGQTRFTLPTTNDDNS